MGLLNCTDYLNQVFNIFLGFQSYIIIDYIEMEIIKQFTFTVLENIPFLHELTKNNVTYIVIFH